MFETTQLGSLSNSSTQNYNNSSAIFCSTVKLDFQNGYTRLFLKLLFFQVKDPDVMGKMVHDTWNEMNGGISVRIKKFKICSAYVEMSSYTTVEQCTIQVVDAPSVLI